MEETVWMQMMSNQIAGIGKVIRSSYMKQNNQSLKFCRIL
jgi:hypothetical protein